MAVLQIFKETALPGTLQNHSVYIISPPAEPDYVEVYVTGADAATTVRRLLREDDVQAMIDASLAGFANLQTVADIAARDALVLSQNTLVLVADASADATVDAGSATYLWKEGPDVWEKIAEYESLDVTLDWNNINGRPSSTPGQIDSAVANSHSHANKSQLDKIDEDGSGNMTYDGSLPATGWASTGW